MDFKYFFRHGLNCTFRTYDSAIAANESMPLLNVHHTGYLLCVLFISNVTYYT